MSVVPSESNPTSVKRIRVLNGPKWGAREVHRFEVFFSVVLSLTMSHPCMASSEMRSWRNTPCEEPIMTQLMQSLLERLTQLPESMQDNLAQQFLKALDDVEAQAENQPPKRVAGLGQGTMVIADDFDAPSPNS